MSSGGTDDLATVEGKCGWAYDLARLDPRDLHGVLVLAEMVLGAGAIVQVHGDCLPAGSGGRLVRRTWTRHLPGAWAGAEYWFIEVHKRLTLVRLVWIVGHELAEWILCEVLAYLRDGVESLANALGAALILPRAVMLPHFGQPLDLTLARAYNVSPACWALRWAELDQQPVLYVAPGKVLRRGPEGFWPEEDAAARRIGRALLDEETPSLRGLRIRDFGGAEFVRYDLGRGRYLVVASNDRYGAEIIVPDPEPRVVLPPVPRVELLALPGVPAGWLLERDEAERKRLRVRATGRPA